LVDSRNQEIRTIFMKLPETYIELQFTQRPSPLTYGHFTVQQLEELLVETHESIITDPYCGQDRWMDNHFEFTTWGTRGLMGRIHSNLKMEGVTYRVTKNPIERASVYTKSRLEQIGYDGDYVFGMWLVDPTGQTVQVGGVLSDEEVAEKAPFWDSNWCEHECDEGMVKGIVDADHIYETAKRELEEAVDSVDIEEIDSEDFIEFNETFIFVTEEEEEEELMHRFSRHGTDEAYLSKTAYVEYPGLHLMQNIDIGTLLLVIPLTATVCILMIACCRCCGKYFVFGNVVECDDDRYIAV